MSHEPPPSAFPLYGYFGIIMILLGFLGFLNYLSGDASEYEPLLGVIVIATGTILTGFALFRIRPK